MRAGALKDPQRALGAIPEPLGFEAVDREGAGRGGAPKFIPTSGRTWASSLPRTGAGELIAGEETLRRGPVSA